MLTFLGACDETPPPPPEPPELSEIPSRQASERVSLATPTNVELPSPVSGRSADEAVPTDVLARLKLLRTEVELLRRYMGRPRPGLARLRVVEANPRVVYQQVARLYERVNILSFEITRTLGSPPSPPELVPKPPDVFRLVDAALERVLVTKEALGISEEVAEQRLPDDATPTDAFHEAVAAAGDVNGLVTMQTSPTDVFQQVTGAVHAAAAIHATLPGVKFPEEPAFEPNKVPADGYRVLLDCYEELRLLAASRQLPLIKLEVSKGNARDAAPDDVSELAVLLRAETRFVLSKWPNAGQALEAFDPGMKFPSHVHRRARLLLAILQDANARSR